MSSSCSSCSSSTNQALQTLAARYPSVSDEVKRTNRNLATSPAASVENAGANVAPSPTTNASGQMVGVLFHFVA